MAIWTKRKVNASEVNNGNEFNAGDGVRNTDINKIFQSSLYSQDVVSNIKVGNVTTTDSGGNASATITYDSNGYPLINLVLPRGLQGIQGPAGSVGTLKKLLYSGYISPSGNATFTMENNQHLLLFIDATMDYSTIVNLSSDSSSDFTYQKYITMNFGTDYMETQYNLVNAGVSRTKVNLYKSIVVNQNLSDGRFNVYKSDWGSSHLIYIYELMF